MKRLLLSLVLLVASRFVWLLIQNLMFADKTEKHVRRALIIGAGTQGAETINILATKSGGTVIFANMINNYNIALYITEAISRQLDIRCADGYLEAYDEFDDDEDYPPEEIRLMRIKFMSDYGH